MVEGGGKVKEEEIINKKKKFVFIRANFPEQKI